MLKSIGEDQSKEMIKHGVEVAISSGIEKAKKSLTKKYGASKAAKIVPYLSFFLGHIQLTISLQLWPTDIKRFFLLMQPLRKKE